MTLAKRYRLVGDDQKLFLVDRGLLQISVVRLHQWRTQTISNRRHLSENAFFAGTVTEVRKALGDTCKFVLEADDPSEFLEMDDYLFPKEIEALLRLV